MHAVKQVHPPLSLRSHIHHPIAYFQEIRYLQSAGYFCKQKKLEHTISSKCKGRYIAELRGAVIAQIQFLKGSMQLSSLKAVQVMRIPKNNEQQVIQDFYTSQPIHEAVTDHKPTKLVQCTVITCPTHHSCRLILVLESQERVFKEKSTPIVSLQLGENTSAKKKKRNKTML